MGIFEELATEYGLDDDDANQRLVDDLARCDQAFLQQLVEFRHLAGFTQEDLAKAWGRHKTAVSQFERLGADPRLSTIRRYAASIGARYRHDVVLDRDIHPAATKHLAEIKPLELRIKGPAGHSAPENREITERTKRTFPLDTRLFNVVVVSSDHEKEVR